MMKRLLVSGLVFAAMATAALAQQPPAPPEQMAPPAPQDRSAPPPPPAGPDVVVHADDTSPRDRAGSPMDDNRPEMGLYRHHRQMPPPPPSKAAHFRIENGGTKIDIKCADDEPTKVCADVLLQLIDKLAAPTDNQDDQRD